METSRAVFGDGQRAVCRDAGDPDAGAELEVGCSREREDTSGRDDGVLLGGAARGTTVAGEDDPDAVADAEADDTRTKLVDDSRAVLIRDSRFGDRAAGCAAARLESVGFTPETTTRIRTSPSAGSGIGRSTSSSTDGSPGRV
jgi:hypothetical protein